MQQAGEDKLHIRLERLEGTNWCFLFRGKMSDELIGSSPEERLDLFLWQ